MDRKFGGRRVANAMGVMALAGAVVWAGAAGMAPTPGHCSDHDCHRNGNDRCLRFVQPCRQLRLGHGRPGRHVRRLR